MIRFLCLDVAYALIKVIAYNLLNWMKAPIMPGEVKTYRAGTLRRKIFCIPGNGGGFRKVHSDGG